MAGCSSSRVQGTERVRPSRNVCNTQPRSSQPLPALALPCLPQGVGAPACATILTAWFAAAERGTYWGMWNIAHNLGGFLAPVIVGECG
jgi:hypothetical protein